MRKLRCQRTYFLRYRLDFLRLPGQYFDQHEKDLELNKQTFREHMKGYSIDCHRMESLLPGRTKS
jgi:hypothetical protein